MNSKYSQRILEEIRITQRHVPQGVEFECHAKGELGASVAYANELQIWALGKGEKVCIPNEWVARWKERQRVKDIGEGCRFIWWSNSTCCWVYINVEGVKTFGRVDTTVPQISVESKNLRVQRDKTGTSPTNLPHLHHLELRAATPQHNSHPFWFELSLRRRAPRWWGSLQYASIKPRSLATIIDRVVTIVDSQVACRSASSGSVVERTPLQLLLAR
ncbi:hypothetical protein R3P38DRAFT_2775808 [Favolaschia claudopus]|uniref:Uncharacterized protein n=1 Tax=Favolaschia claudopus TaxID=2862362 RepID=A0AAW0BSQ4_9AGAR